MEISNNKTPCACLTCFNYTRLIILVVGGLVGVERQFFDSTLSKVEDSIAQLGGIIPIVSLM